MEDKGFIIFNVSELNQIDFNEVMETDSSTLRISTDGIKTFVKWIGATPSCISNLTTKEGPYTYNEMMSILDTSNWKPSGIIP